jgi:predicted DNA-binding transcriptional regulator AlpA
VDHDSVALSPDDAALKIGLAKSTLAKLRLSGKGPTFIKLGRRVVYRQADLIAWIEMHRFRSTSEYR